MLKKILKKQNFVHCHLHSEYSFLDSIIKVKGLGKILRSKGYMSCALTDHGNINGIYAFVTELKKAGVKPIVGCEFYIVPDRTRKGLTDEERAEFAGDLKAREAKQAIKEGEKRLGIRERSHVVCLAKNNRGWRKMIRALELAYSEGFYYFPRIDYDLLRGMASDVVVMTACLGGVPGRLISKGEFDSAAQWCDDMADTFGDDFFIEIQPNDIDAQVEMNTELVRLAQQVGVPLVATNDVHYLDSKDWETHDALLALRESQRGKTVLVTDPERFKYPTNQLYLKTRAEMELSFTKFHPDIDPEIWQQALDNTLAIDAVIEPDIIEVRKAVLPNIKIETEYEGNPDKQLWGLVRNGWKWRKVKERCEGRTGFVDWIDGEPPREASLFDVCAERVKYEMREVTRLGFSKYFLVIWDLVKWARSVGIRVGPGRGSVGGSYVAYLLGITSVDSVRFGCPFSRFISPDRIDYPDIDIDFPTVERGRIKQYLIDKYGAENVAGICTFGKMKGRAVLKDVGRVHNIPWQKTESVTKLVVARLDGDERADNTLEDTFATFGETKGYQREYPTVVRHAQKLEGNVRQLGVHAAGMVISDEPLRNLVPVQWQRDRSKKEGGLGEYLTGWDKREVEAVGLLKLDILGIEGLTYIQRTLDLIKERYGEEIEPEEWVDFDDAKVWENFQQGNTELVWQMNTFNTIRVLRRLKPTKFDHLVATTSLIRPGPMNAGITDDYIARRHGKKAKGIHPVIDTLLSETHGLFVYQENVIQIVHDVGGFSWGEADRIRKDIGKKKGAEYLRTTYLDRFVAGAGEHGIDPKRASIIWGQISEFGSYGFNKCLSGDTLVYRAGANENCKPTVSIEELFIAQGESTPWGQKIRAGKLNIIQMDDDGRMRPGRLKKIYINGRRGVFEIETRSGRHIKCTLNHRLLTNSGYEIVDNLIVGDCLVCMGSYEGRKPTSLPIRGRGVSYIGEPGRGGVPFGEENPGWIDGRSVAHKEAKCKVLERTKGRCEKCCVEKNDDDRFEFTHIDSLETCNGNYIRYNSESNIKYLCNSCHKKLDYKKGERKKRWTKGRPAILDEIISIRGCGMEIVYDIEMDTINHNFIANGIVSHNSHATGYSLLSYWTMFLKLHYPLEFMTAALEKETDSTKRHRYIKEAKRLGINVMPPDANASGFSFTIDDNLPMTVRCGLTDVKGVAEKSAQKIIDGKPYSNLLDFLLRSGANKTVVRAFLRIGALDTLVKNPKRIDENLDAVLKVKKRKKQNQYWEDLILEPSKNYTRDERDQYKLDLVSLPPSIHPVIKAVPWLTEHCPHVTFNRVEDYEQLFDGDFSSIHRAFIGVCTKAKMYEDSGQTPEPAPEGEPSESPRKVFQNQLARINIEDETGALTARTSVAQLQALGASKVKEGNLFAVIGHSIGFFKVGCGAIVNLTELMQAVDSGNLPEPGTPEHFILNDPFEGARKFIRTRDSLLPFEKGKRSFRTAVTILGAEHKLTKKRQRMMVICCQDWRGAIRDVVLWPSDYHVYNSFFEVGKLMLLRLKSRVEGGKTRRYFLNTTSGVSPVMSFKKYFAHHTGGENE